MLFCPFRSYYSFILISAIEGLFERIAKDALDVLASNVASRNTDLQKGTLTRGFDYSKSVSCDCLRKKQKRKVC